MSLTELHHFPWTHIAINAFTNVNGKRVSATKNMIIENQMTGAKIAKKTGNKYSINLHGLRWYNWFSCSYFASYSFNLHISWWKVQNIAQRITANDIRMLHEKVFIIDGFHEFSQGNLRHKFVLITQAI